ncbi:MAG: type II toxin-antitoxin system VapC family toxin [Litorimonas sp.]
MLSAGVIVDASIALKWVIAEDGSNRAVRLLDGRPLHAPCLLLTEAANALWVIQRRGTINGDGAADALARLRTAPLVFPVSDGDLVGQALRLAQFLDHPAYDCVYLALAIERRLPVVTADRRFAKAAARNSDTIELVRLLDDA